MYIHVHVYTTTSSSGYVHVHDIALGMPKQALGLAFPKLGLDFEDKPTVLYF